MPQVRAVQPVDRLNRGEHRGRAIALTDGDRPVQLHRGISAQRQHQVIQRNDPVPIGIAPASSGAMAGGQVRLQLVRARHGTRAPHRLRQQRGTFPDHRVVPPAPVLVPQQHRLAPVRAGAGGPPRGGEQQQSEQPEDLRLTRHQVAQQPRQPDGLQLIVDPGNRVSAARRVRLGRDEVNDRQHGREPFGQLAIVGNLVGDPRGGDLLPRPDQALGHRLLRHPERPRDRRDIQAGQRPQREGDPCLW
jgi:hypothetical protein